MERLSLIVWGGTLAVLAVGCSHERLQLPEFPSFAQIMSPPAKLDDTLKQNPAIESASFSSPKVVDVANSSAVPGPLTLCQAVEIGLQQNPRLRAAQAAVDRAGGREETAFAPFLPQVDMLNRYVATSSSLSPGAPGLTGGIINKGSGPFDAWQTELQIQWILYDFGRTAGRYGQAEMGRTIAQLQSRRMSETVAYEIATAFYQALEAVALQKIAEESIRSAEAVLEDTRARRAAGVALRDDVLRNDVQLAEARDALVRARESELAAQARLNNAMGRDASLPLNLADEPVRPPFQCQLADSMRQAIESRPEVGVTRDRIAAAQFGRQAAHGEFLPSVSLRGSLGRVDGQDVVNGWQEGVGIHINMPLYHGGQRRGELRAAEADIRQAVAESQNLLNDIGLQVTLAHRAATFANERVGLARPAVTQAEEALRIVRQRFRNGTATPTDVVDAETALTRSQQRLASARIEYLAALAQLGYATGEQPERFCAPRAEKIDVPPTELPAPRIVPVKAVPPVDPGGPVEWKRSGDADRP